MSTHNEDHDSLHDSPGGRELASGFAQLRNQAGLPTTDEERMRARVVKVSLPIHEVIRKVVSYLATGDYGLYRRGREIGTIDEITGEWVVMDPVRFVSWLPMECQIMPIQKWKKKKDNNGEDDVDGEWVPVMGELSQRQAAQILGSDDLRKRVPEVEHIHKVKLPVYRKELDLMNAFTGEEDEKRAGFRKIDLLKQGYDEESKTFTLRGGLDYDEDWSEERATAYLTRLLRYFPWAEGLKGRSIAVQVAAMLTLYAARLFRGRSPMFMWNANLPGSGKSRLAQLCVHAVHGSAARAGFSYENKDEVRKELDAVAQVFGPYVFFDDLQRGTVRNEHLHRWLTAPDWSCRVMGTKELFHGNLFAATLMTGNELKLNDDLERRTLVLDLFSRQTARERVLPNDVEIMDDDYFADESKRSEVLSALWGLLKYWDMLHRPLPKDKLLDSFEGWSRVIPAIVQEGGFGNALAPFSAPDAGNVAGREMETLVQAVIDELMPSRPENLPADEYHSVIVTLQSVVGVARRGGLFQDKLWTVAAVLESDGERQGFKYKRPAGPAANADVPFEEDGANDVPESRDPLRIRQAEVWMNHSMRSWFGKYFKSKAASGRYWKHTASGEVYELGSRGGNDLSKVRITRMSLPSTATAPG